MPRKVRKKAVRQSPLKPEVDENVAPAGNSNLHQFKERQFAFSNQEVERRTAAVQAICVAETENVLSRLRLLRSYLSKEQLETPALKFFKENLPNTEVIRNEKYQIFELQWNNKEIDLPENYNDDVNLGASISNAFSIPSTSALQFSVQSVKKNLIENAHIQMHAFGLDKPSETQICGRQEAYETPGATSNRLSFGMTPKTLRLPKNGEMLLSVHGSPLGVYKEESLAAIDESGDGSGSHEDAFLSFEGRHM